MRTQKARELLQGKTIIVVNDNDTNVLTLLLDDGTRVAITADTLYGVNGANIPTIEVTKDN